MALCPQTLCPQTLYQHTLFVHTHFVTTHFVHKHFVHKHFVHTRFINIHFVTTTHTHTQHTSFCTHTHGTGWRAWTGLGATPQTLCTHTTDIHLSFTASFCVAGVHRWHWVARLDTRRGTLRGTLTSTFVSRGTWHKLTHLRFTHSHTGLGNCDTTHNNTRGTPDIHLSFTQAWHNVLRGNNWVARLDIHLSFTHTHNLTSTFTLRGRRGTDGTGWRAWTGLGACDAAALCVAGVAQPDIHLRFTWQAWHKLTSTFVSRGRRGTHGTGWRAWTGLGACDAAALCVAGVAQPDIHLRFTWQAWHKLTSTFVSRGRRGTHGTGWRAWTGLGACDAAALCVAGVAQPDIHLRFTWQAWHKLTSTFVSRGRRGTHGTGWRAWTGLGACDAAALCVAGVAQPHTHLRFTWQAWRGTKLHLPSFCVAGVALMALGGALGPAWAPVTPRHFAWQAWHNLTSTFLSRGRRGTKSHPASFCVAGVRQMALGGALGPAWAPVTPRHFAWQAWHNLTSTFVSRGRRGTKSHPPSFCVAGVGQMALGGALGPAWAPVTPRHFAWQAWHNLTSTFVSRGRRGTKLHLPSFCVAGVALMALGGALGPAWAPVTPRHFAWQAWHNLTSTFLSRGRRGTKSHPASFCVAGVRQMALGGALGPAWAPVTPRHFAWQAWHNLTSTFVTRGRRGTKSHPPSFCVAGVGQMALGGALGPAWAPVTPRHFAWQAWHNLTSTFISRGRRGTKSHPPSFCVAGVGQMALGGALGPAWAPVTPRHFAWQAWHKVTSTVVLRGRCGTDGTGWRAWTGLGACDAAALCVAGLHVKMRSFRHVSSFRVLRHV